MASTGKRRQATRPKILLSTRKLSVRIALTRKDLAEVFSIRENVFQREQKVDKKLEFDGKDGQAVHFLARIGEKPAGCVRIRFARKTALLERMAVLKQFRGNGIGSKLVEAAIPFCRKKKAKQLEMHAQCRAETFYEKLGFRRFGKEFKEIGFAHVGMRLKLGPRNPARSVRRKKV